MESVFILSRFFKGGPYNVVEIIGVFKTQLLAETCLDILKNSDNSDRYKIQKYAVHCSE